jgi:hypothetical protein
MPIALATYAEEQGGQLSDTHLFVLVGKLTTDISAETLLEWRDSIASTVYSERRLFMPKFDALGFTAGGGDAMGSFTMQALLNLGKCQRQ